MRHYYGCRNNKDAQARIKKIEGNKVDNYLFSNELSASECFRNWMYNKDCEIIYYVRIGAHWEEVVRKKLYV